MVSPRESVPLVASPIPVSPLEPSPKVASTILVPSRSSTLKAVSQPLARKTFTAANVPWLRQPCESQSMKSSAPLEGEVAPVPPPCGDQGEAGAVELCAGSALLTESLSKVGFEACGVDYRENRHTPVGKVVLLDLTLQSGVASVWTLICHPNLKYTHMGPPCGTASMARGVRLPLQFRGKWPEPKPLRTISEPLGVEKMSAKDAIRVAKANQLYALCAEVARFCTAKGIPWTIENPENSLFWHVPDIVALLSLEKVGDIHFENCMLGSSRRKKTRLRAYPASAFESLAVLCDGSHSHPPWRRGPAFSTSLECAYPQQFCDKLAACAAAAASLPPAPSAKRPLPPGTAEEPSSKIRKVKLAGERAAVGRQSRGDPLPPLISEFKRVWHARCPANLAKAAEEKKGSWLKAPFHLGDESIPVDSKILEVNILEVGIAGPVKGEAVVPPTRACLADVPVLGEQHVYIGRALSGKRRLPASEWANIYRLWQCESRSDCLIKYEQYLRSPAMAEFLRRELGKLAGKILVCPSCRTGEACHADVIIKIFREVFDIASATRPASLKVGEPWTPEEFVAQAEALVHPFDSIVAPDAILRNVFTLLTVGPKSLAAARAETLEHWRRRAKELDPQEQELRSKMHDDVRPTMSSKRILLFGEMLTAAGVPKANDLCHLLASGFTITGEVPASGLFPAERREPEKTIEDVWRDAPLVREAIWASLRPSDDPELDQEVTAATKAEEEQGWLRGPIPWEDAAARHSRFTVARRFGIRQGGAVRVIDDYSENGVNATVGTSERIDVGGVDSIIAIAKAVMASLAQDSREVKVVLSDGTSLEGTLHASLSPSSARKLLGKVFDLSKAYRRLARAPSGASVMNVATWNSTLQQPELYEQLVLPFGAGAVVQHFNRTARGLQQVLVVLFQMLATHYFDDFSVLELEQEVASAEALVVDFFDLLGWDLKDHVPFAQSFTPLGVEIDFSAADSDRIVVCNKATRVDEMCQSVDAYLEQGFLRPHEARSFRGRFVFALGQTFGRCGSNASRSIGRAAESVGPTPLASGVVREALRWTSHYLRHAKPRVVTFRGVKPALILTDGACEDGDVPGKQVATVGGVLCGRGVAPDRFFGAIVPPDIVERLAEESGSQVIGQIELAPIWIAKRLWHEHITDTRAIFFVDNNSARFAMIRGYSSVCSSGRLVDACWGLDSELGTASWYSRVPSPSNISDAPSRLQYEELLRGGAVQDEITPMIWDQLRLVLG